MKKLLTIPLILSFLMTSFSVFGKTVTCTPDESYSGNDSFIKRSIGDPLPLKKLNITEKLSLDFENKTYKTKSMSKKISNISSIGNEIVGTVTHGGGDGFFQLHYNKKTKKLFKTSNGGLFHDYLKRYVTMIEVTTYDCK